MGTTTQHGALNLAEMAKVCEREFDATRASNRSRHVSFPSAQQRTQRSQGISSAIKLGFGLAVALVILAVAL